MKRAGKTSATASEILAEPGDVSLNTLLVEIDKLNVVRFVGVPAGVLDDIAQPPLESTERSSYWYTVEMWLKNPWPSGIPTERT